MIKAFNLCLLLLIFTSYSAHAGWYLKPIAGLTFGKNEGEIVGDNAFGGYTVALDESVGRPDTRFLTRLG